MNIELRVFSDRLFVSTHGGGGGCTGGSWGGVATLGWGATARLGGVGQKRGRASTVEGLNL